MKTIEIETKYMTFKLVQQKEKTQVWNVLNKSSGFLLAIIKWYPSWRQYCFFPEPNAVFNQSCLKDISDFINARMIARKSKF